MNKTASEPYRDIDFTDAERGPVAPLEPNMTRISIRLDNRVLDHFRSVVEKAGGGNFQSLINDALTDYVQRQSRPKVVRNAMREDAQPALEQVLADGRGDHR